MLWEEVRVWRGGIDIPEVELEFVALVSGAERLRRFQRREKGGV
jgi:hypothetical protein